MNLTYTKVESNIKPELIDSTSSQAVVYVRKDIEEKIRTDLYSGDTTTYYEYQEAKLTPEEYDKYVLELNATSVLDEIETLKNLIKELKGE